MNKTIPFLIAILVISTTLGSATALVIPVDFSTTDNVKLYTSEFTTNVPAGVTPIIQNSCDAGDTIVNGYVQVSTATNIAVSVNHSIINLGNDGWRVVLTNNGATSQDITLVIVCGKIVPMMAIGGLHLEPDTTALLVGYSLLNMYWIAPTVIGIGVGAYLVKRKF